MSEAMLIEVKPIKVEAVIRLAERQGIQTTDVAAEVRRAITQMLPTVKEMLRTA